MLGRLLGVSWAFSEKVWALGPKVWDFTMEGPRPEGRVQEAPSQVYCGDHNAADWPWMGKALLHGQRQGEGFHGLPFFNSKSRISPLLYSSRVLDQMCGLGGLQ